MKRVRRMCAIMVDTLGREMLIKRPFKLGPDGWPMHDTPFKVAQGSSLTITTRDEPATPTLLPITYPKFPSLLQPGDVVYIGRYMACGAPEMASLYLRVEQVDLEAGDVVCTALNDAEMYGLLTVFNLERSANDLVSLQNDLPVLTEYDKQALKELADAGIEIDFVSISYCRTGADVRDVRSFTEGVPGLAAAALVAKVETRQALLNFRGILEAADGITISRGLLGLDCLPEKVALIQKQLISECNLAGKPVVVTRVLDSMTDNPRPTRAEATDVANAVLDGADALFLGAETLRGRNPVATVRTLVSIARQAERVFDFRHHFEWLMQAAMDAQELKDLRAAARGFMGGGLDDDDAATDIFMLSGGMGGLGLSGMGGLGSVGAGLSGLGGGGGAGGGCGGAHQGGYGDLGGLTPLASIGPGGGGGAAAAAGGGGLSPASLSASNLDELADGGAGGGGGNGGGGHHVSFSGLPPRPPTRTRSNVSMPDINTAGGGGGGGGLNAAHMQGGPGSISATGGSPALGTGVGASLGGGGGAAGGENGGHGSTRSQSYADINTAVAAMERFGTGPGGYAGGGGGGGGSVVHSHHHHHGSHHHVSGRASPSVRSTAGTLYGGGPTGPYMGKLESIASSAVRAAEKVKASLIVVYTHTSRVAQLVAKYRPPMPILTLVVPRLTSDGLHWRLQGRGHARQCLMVRGLLPMLSAPGPSGDEILEEAIAMASRLGLVGPGHHVVVVERVHDAFCLKIVAVDELGLGIEREGPVDPAAVVVRAMVPATPVVGRTLSMMNDARLPSAALMAAAAAATRANSGGSGGGGTSAFLGTVATDLNFGPPALGPVMGAITSLLAQSPSSYGAYGGAAAPDGTAIPGNGSSGRPRRLTSRELIGAVPTSPFTGSPPVGVGLAGAPASGGVGGGGGGGTPGSGGGGNPNSARLSLLNTLMAAQQGGGGGGGGGVLQPTSGLPVLNALGGGSAARDGVMTAPVSVGIGGIADVSGDAAGLLAPLTRVPLGVVTEEPESNSPFQDEEECAGEGKGGVGHGGVCSGSASVAGRA